MVSEFTPAERAATVTYILATGGKLTPKRVSELTECCPDTARRLLNRLARVIPITEVDGVFVMVKGR